MYDPESIVKSGEIPEITTIQRLEDVRNLSDYPPEIETRHEWVADSDRISIFVVLIAGLLGLSIINAIWYLMQ